MISIDARFDAVATVYLAEMRGLVNGRSSMVDHARQQERLGVNTVQSVYLLAGGDAADVYGRNYLIEQQRIIHASSISLAAAVAGGLSVAGLLHRLWLWIHSLAAVYQRGMIVARPLVQFQWILGNTEEHCTTCLMFNTQIKSGRAWLALAEQGLAPQGKRLECGGWMCDCHLRMVG